MVLSVPVGLLFFAASWGLFKFTGRANPGPVATLHAKLHRWRASKPSPKAKAEGGDEAPSSQCVAPVALEDDEEPVPSREGDINGARMIPPAGSSGESGVLETAFLPLRTGSDSCLVEYFQLNECRWVEAMVGARLSMRPTYSRPDLHYWVQVAGTGQVVDVVAVDCFRDQLRAGEPVEVWFENGWFAGEVAEGAASDGLVLPRLESFYEVSLLMDPPGTPCINVSALRVRRRYIPGNPVEVYMGAEAGWRSARVATVDVQVAPDLSLHQPLSKASPAVAAAAAAAEREAEALVPDIDFTLFQDPEERATFRRIGDVAGAFLRNRPPRPRLDAGDTFCPELMVPQKEEEPREQSNQDAAAKRAFREGTLQPWAAVPIVWDARYRHGITMPSYRVRAHFSL